MDSLPDQEDPWRRGLATPLQNSYWRNPVDKRSLVGYGPWSQRGEHNRRKWACMYKLRGTQCLNKR